MALQQMSRYFQMRFSVLAKYSFVCQRDYEVCVAHQLGVTFQCKEFGYGLASVENLSRTTVWPCHATPTYVKN